jgi:hypothetical protein
MENPVEYINHINTAKELNFYNTASENQKSYEQKFENIYKKAKDEMKTLQKHEGLAESINIDAIFDEEIKSEKLSTQNEFDLKQKLLSTTEDTSEEPLANAIEETQKETRTPEEIIAQYRAMPGMSGVAYEGMFEEIQADFLAKHESYFEEEYELYEKYKDVFTPLYSNYTDQKADAIMNELVAQFPDYKETMQKAYYGGSEEDKEAWEDMFYDYQAYNKYLREKHDLEMSPNTIMGAMTPESTKAYNYAVYDALEQGVSVEEATKKAQQLLSVFGDSKAQGLKLMFFGGYEDYLKSDTENIVEEEIDYDKQIDLRDVGFEHNFWSDAYVEVYGKDSIGVKSRIMYDIKLYSFLLENEDLIDRKLDELKERAYLTENGKDWYDWQNENGKFNEEFKAPFLERYERAVYAKEIYDKYSSKIYEKT